MNKVLCLRTCDANRRGHGGFQWPESGPVEAPDWSAEPCCGKGLHGLLWGEGDAGHLSAVEDAVWMVVEVDATAVVDLRGKVKFPRGEVVYCGMRDEAVAYILAHGGAGRACAYARVTAGYMGTATAGYRGTATAGDEGTATAGDEGTATAGYRGTATAGDRGTATAGDRGTATAWDRGTATAGDEGTATAGDEGTATAGYRGTATAGERGTATAGNWGTATAGNGGTATAGDRGTATAGYGGTATAGYGGTATAGYRGTATAGYRGTVCVRWYDGTASRHRLAVGYVGEDGIEANVPYRVEGRGVLVCADK